MSLHVSLVNYGLSGNLQRNKERSKIIKSSSQIHKNGIHLAIITYATIADNGKSNDSLANNGATQSTAHQLSWHPVSGHRFWDGYSVLHNKVYRARVGDSVRGPCYLSLLVPSYSTTHDCCVDLAVLLTHFFLHFLHFFLHVPFICEYIKS